jgi:hypothetical protein
LVSSQSFPHLWKKLWKSTISVINRAIYTEFSRVFREAKVAGGCKTGAVSAYFPAHPRFIESYLRRKSAPTRFS